jgi:hypothetical protein
VPPGTEKISDAAGEQMKQMRVFPKAAGRRTKPGIGSENLKNI